MSLDNSENQEMASTEENQNPNGNPDSESVSNYSNDDSHSPLSNADEDKFSEPVSSTERSGLSDSEENKTPPIPDKAPEQQEDKPAIYSNRWGIPVDDSFKFETDPVTSYENFQSFIKANHKELEDWLEKLIENNEMLPMPFRPSSPEHKTDKFIRVAPEDVKDKDVWFIGDVHGDFLSLTASLKSINFDVCSSSFYMNKTIIVLLGDIFDRIDDSFETFFAVLWLLYTFHNIVWLSGNHDFVTYSESTDSFYSPTSPSDYTQWLNDPEAADDEMHPIARRITKLYSRLIDSLPAGLYFPDGLFVSHGGFPHPHWYESVKKWGDFNNSNFVYDFYWKRVHETKRHAAFSASSKSGQLGIEDFDSFCNLLKDRFKSPISAFLRGHDHYPERIKFFDAYKIPVITINTMSCAKDGCDPIGKFGYQTTPVIIKYQPTIPDNYVSCAEMDTIEPEQDIDEDVTQTFPSPSSASEESHKEASSDSSSTDVENCETSDSIPVDVFNDQPSDSLADSPEIIPENKAEDKEDAADDLNCNKDAVAKDAAIADNPTADESELKSSEDSKSADPKKPSPESISDSNVESDSASQDSTVSPDNNASQPLPIPNIVIYRIGITRELLNNWYPPR